MGFLSGLSGILGGGSQTKSSGSSQSGWALLPDEIKKSYTTFANAVTPQIANAGSMYKPIGQTAGETQAYNAINKGFAPTQESLNSDVSMFMNPFNDYVINGLNRDAASNYSILKQAANEAGQFGSNRQMLGANDIEQTRLNTIGNLRANEYNTAVGNVLNNLIPTRQADAQAQLAAGGNQRQLALQQATAPITGLQQVGAALGILPTNGGSTQQQSSSTNQSQGGTFGNLVSAGAGLLGLFSDKRLKENIVKVGHENGHNIYEFNYKGSPNVYRGVIAQEVEKKRPDAVKTVNGEKVVDYDKIGVQMRMVR